MTTKKTKTKIEIKHVSDVSVDELLNTISARYHKLALADEKATILLKQKEEAVLQLQQKVQNLTDSLNSIQKIAGK